MGGWKEGEYCVGRFCLDSCSVARVQFPLQVHNVCLFRCEKCEIFFKSKKGYEGHVANRHTPRVLGLDGRLKSKKEIEGLNKVNSVLWKKHHKEVFN